MPNQLSTVKHIVQLMMENRSFDQMLGFLYESTGNVSAGGQPFEGLTGKESNPDDTSREIPVYKIDSNAPHPYLSPGRTRARGFTTQTTSYFQRTLRRRARSHR